MLLFNRHLMTTSECRVSGLPQGAGGRARLLQSPPGQGGQPRGTRSRPGGKTQQWVLDKG